MRLSSEIASACAQLDVEGAEGVRRSKAFTDGRVDQSAAGGQPAPRCCCRLRWLAPGRPSPTRDHSSASLHAPGDVLAGPRRHARPKPPILGTVNVREQRVLWTPCFTATIGRHGADRASLDQHLAAVRPMKIRRRMLKGLVLPQPLGPSKRRRKLSFRGSEVSCFPEKRGRCPCLARSRASSKPDPPLFRQHRRLCHRRRWPCWLLAAHGARRARASIIASGCLEGHDISVEATQRYRRCPGACVGRRNSVVGRARSSGRELAVIEARVEGPAE